MYCPCGEILLVVDDAPGEDRETMESVVYQFGVKGRFVQTAAKLMLEPVF